MNYLCINDLAGTLYCGVFMLIRLMDGSYSPGGRFFNAIEESLRPSFGVKDYSGKGYMVFILISMLTTAFVAHYNAPKFMTELKDATAEKYTKIVKVSFAFAAAVYMAIMWIGFLTWGGASTGFVLNNYAGTDTLATIARIAIGFGIVCGYPLTFTALRDGVFDIVGLKSTEGKSKYFYMVTIGILAVITQAALILRNLGAVIGFSGALIGSLLLFILPGNMNIANIKRELSLIQDKNPSTTLKEWEIKFNQLLKVFGVILAVLGVSTTLMSS